MTDRSLQENVQGAQSPERETPVTLIGIRSPRSPVSVNSNRSVRFEAPFGGYKRSGLGRELGMGAMDAYTEVKNVFFSE